MPKRVDHAVRKRQIADALLRIACSTGLHRAGMREVAAEAGVSLRLVQYYFGTREQLLFFGLEYLGEQLGQRIRARIDGAVGPATPRDVVEAVLAEALPTDEARRTLHLVYTAFHVLALTDERLGAQPYMQGPTALENSLVAQLGHAQTAGLIAPDLDIRAEAAGLLAMSAGLSNSILARQRSVDAARAVIDYHLKRLFRASGEEEVTTSAS